MADIKEERGRLFNRIRNIYEHPEKDVEILNDEPQFFEFIHIFFNRLESKRTEKDSDEKKGHIYKEQN